MTKIQTQLHGLGLDLQMRYHFEDISVKISTDLTPLIVAFLDGDIPRLDAVLQQAPRIQSQLNDGRGAKVKTLGICLSALAVRSDRASLMDWLEGCGADTLGAKWHGSCHIDNGGDKFIISPIEEALQRSKLRILTHWREKYGTDFIRSSNIKGYAYIVLAAENDLTDVVLHLLELDPSVVDHRFPQLQQKRLAEHLDVSNHPAMASVIRSWQAQRAARSAMDELKQSKLNPSAHLD